MSCFELAPHRLPPSPEVLARLFERYSRDTRDERVTFAEFLQREGCACPVDRGHRSGMEDGQLLRIGSGPQLVSTPAHPVRGSLVVKVLLVDFPDLEGTTPPSHYEQLLFSRSAHATGSMRDYFAEVSLGQVDVQGSVDGWLRMPQPYAYYVGGESGLGAMAYPRDARGLAEHAVQAAIEQGVCFDDALDPFGEGTIAALFIVHAGVGAEVQLDARARRANLWSHKWQMVRPVEIRPGLVAHRYLTVPHDCSLGVCAHELGHLAFQWEDFYDPNGSRDGREWDGSGRWDLMASGSYNGESRSPAHPAALHKLQHGWIEVERIDASQRVVLDPYTATTGKAVEIVSTRYREGQRLVLENRARLGFDAALPGEGLLVWRYDRSKTQDGPDEPALLLLQADGRRDLERAESPARWNDGDAGDPFPGASHRTTLRDAGLVSTSFPGGDPS
ncbi:MAG: M6 family metalloprotease domain-containing protein, partial [Myxococcales bacterium]|nr:M6 family metalloprotease domain-containing protein [Myxococcales bacterium]